MNTETRSDLNDGSSQET